MSEPGQPRSSGEESDVEKAPRTINLWLVYGLMFLALLVAIGVALMIVLPFYQRR
ncbi:MAG TPA: hypothetical protein VGL22_10575 [Terracidiphilus sp.]|jgi:hypothetical protein